jgi:hypothetical protein
MIRLLTRPGLDSLLLLVTLLAGLTALGYPRLVSSGPAVIPDPDFCPGIACTELTDTCCDPNVP